MDKIRKNDEVIVLTGKDKGKRGVVQRRVDANYLVVEGVNVAKKATKPNPMTGATGGIVDKLVLEDVDNLLDTLSTVDVAVHEGPSKTNRLDTESEQLQDIRSVPNTTISVDFDLVEEVRVLAVDLKGDLER